MVEWCSWSWARQCLCEAASAKKDPADMSHFHARQRWEGVAHKAPANKLPPIAALAAEMRLSSFLGSWHPFQVCLKGNQKENRSFVGSPACLHGGVSDFWERIQKHSVVCWFEENAAVRPKPSPASCTSTNRKTRVNNPHCQWQL